MFYIHIFAILYREKLKESLLSFKPRNKKELNETKLRSNNMKVMKSLTGIL